MKAKHWITALILEFMCVILTMYLTLSLHVANDTTRGCKLCGRHLPQLTSSAVRIVFVGTAFIVVAASFLTL